MSFASLLLYVKSALMMLFSSAADARFRRIFAIGEILGLQFELHNVCILVKSLWSG